MRRVNTYFVLTAWLFFVPGVALAQTTASSIAGTVRDTTGAVLPGVTVEASSPALIEKVRSVVTDGVGQYRIVDLRPGTYVVTFTLPGFGTVQREGIQLTTGFTAPVNVELRVGEVSETLTVTGEAPIVDVQNTQRQVVMTRDVIDALPVTKNYNSLATLVPGMRVSGGRNPGNSGQEVGGSTGFMATFSTGMAIHGGRIDDQLLQVDGMLAQPLTTPANFIADANYQEVVLNTSANAAENEGSGVNINLIPREGGNTFTGQLFATFSHPNLEASNLTDTLKQQGLKDPNRLKTLWQYSPSLGGPVVKDKLWFFASFTRQRNENYIAGLYYNTNPAAWDYVPDLTRQAVGITHAYDYAFRGTWQATPRNKVTGFWNNNHICSCTLPESTKTSPEATSHYLRDSPLFQATWSAPVTNRLLFEAGVSRGSFPTDTGPQAEAVASQITDTGLNIIYRNQLATKNKLGDPGHTNFVVRGSVSYVTGTHAMKIGVRSVTGSDTSIIREGLNNLSFTALNGVPTQVTYYGFPTKDLESVRPMLGLYAQDQWTLARLTMNLGVRYDYFRSSFPDQSIPPTQWVPFTRAVKGQVAVRWQDLSPRLGLAYDLFGTGKTALKLSAGRYVSRESYSRAAAINAIRSNDSNARRWTDANGDRLVQGDPFNHAANGELGPSTNLKFGQPESSLAYDPDWAYGFRRRPSNWEFSAGIQHELLPRVSVSAGYFRRVYGNFEVTANQAVTPADFDPYCVTTPVDARLPGGGGQQICGLYDLTANKVGQVQRVTTRASNYGGAMEHWNGFDFTMQARLPKVLLQGGVSTGKSTADTCAIATTHPEVTISSAGPLTSGPSTPSAFCHSETPFAGQTQVKLLGSYALPWDVQLAGTFQHIPGEPLGATATYTSAQIAPSLGRPLAASSTARIPIVAPGTLYGPRLSQFDLRLAKTFRIQGARLQGMFDLYNVFNNNVLTSQSSTYGATTGSAAAAPWLVPQAILSARLIKFAVQVEF